MKRSQLIGGLGMTTLLAVCVLAVDVPGDETTNRKLLAIWKNDPGRLAHLQQNVAAFQAMSREQQDQLRVLDQSLHQLDAATQSRLQSVMERYTGWLHRLPVSDRQKIAEASTGNEKIKVVEQILERQWLDSLPKPDQEKLAKVSPDDRGKILAKLQADEEARNKLRMQARRAIDEAALLGPLPLGQPEFRDRVQVYLEESLRPLLNRAEEDRLMKAIEGPIQRRYQAIFELAEGRSPLPFPGPAPPGKKKAIRSWKDLPVAITEKFSEPPPARIVEAEGKWPALGIAILSEAKNGGIALSANLFGPTRLEELPPAAQRFVKEDLMAKLTDIEKKQLSDAETKWPDYPKKVKELADKHRLAVPGISLPGTREMWQGLLSRPRLGKGNL